MRYNPCGRIVDIGRRPYTTVFRPWEGSQEEVEIVWYVVPWSNPVLGFPSRIQSLDWSSMAWAARGVGEVYNAPRVYNGQWEKEFIFGDHVCGTAADFAGHSVKDEELPEVIYNDADLPLCCGPPFIGAGGAVAGGTAEVEVVSGYCPIYHLTGDAFDGLDLIQLNANQWQGTPFGGATLTITAPPASFSGNWEGFLSFGALFWTWTAPGTWDGHGSQLFTFVSGPFAFPDFTATCVP